MAATKPKADLDAMILAAWNFRDSDTTDLAQRFHVSEPYVYNVLAKRIRKPRSYIRLGFAGKRT